MAQNYVLHSVGHGDSAFQTQPQNAEVEVTFLEAHPIVCVPLSHTKHLETHKEGFRIRPPRNGMNRRL